MAFELSFDPSIAEIFDECSEIGYLLTMKGWAEASGGNLSVRLAKTIELSDKEWKRLTPKLRFSLPEAYPHLESQLLVIKATGKRLRDIAKAPSKTLGLGLVQGRNFHILWPNDDTFRPTSELTSHLAIQNYLAKNKPNMKAVLHAHPTELIVLSFLGEHFLKTLNETLWSVYPGMLIFLPEGLGVVPFKPPSSKELAAETVRLVANHRVILWEKHGCLSVGKTLSDCLDMMEISNKSAEIFLKAKYFPGEINELTREELEEIKSQFNLE